jgi:hypothetical protein
MHVRTAQMASGYTVLRVEHNGQYEVSSCHGGEYEQDCHQGPDDGGSKHLWNVGKFLPEDSHLSGRETYLTPQRNCYCTRVPVRDDGDHDDWFWWNNT